MGSGPAIIYSILSLLGPVYCPAYRGEMDLKCSGNRLDSKFMKAGMRCQGFSLVEMGLGVGYYGPNQ